MQLKNRRRRFPVIDRSLQYKFMSMILIYGGITVIFMAIFLFLPDAIAVGDENLGIEIRAVAAERILTLHTRLWPGLIALICIFSLHSFRAFLRVVGPLYRFRLAFNAIEKGDLGVRLRLRKRDFLLREADMFNEMLDVMAEKWKSIQTVGQEALQSLSSLEKSMSEIKDKEMLSLTLETYRRSLEDLMEKSKYFRLSPKETEQKAEGERA